MRRLGAFNLAKPTIGFGILLILIGIVGFVATGASHPTALIPAFFGILILVAGILAQNEARRKHAIHGALGLALLCLLGSVMPTHRVASAGAKMDKHLTAAVCLVYLIFGIKSFIAARKQ